MRTIIQQILSVAAEKYLNYFEENGIIEIARMAEGLKAISEETAREMLSAFIAEGDAAIRSAKQERRADGIKVHERKVSRTLFTALGGFTYERTYFDMPDGKRSYIIDDILKVEPYERIDAGVSARLVNAAAARSFGRSAATVTGGQVSRQSVKNKVMNTGEVLYIPEKAKAMPAALHIFADEDHVNLQNGQNTIIPLITVCEGKARVSKGRNALINAFHVQGYGIKPETHWEYVYALCAEKYDMERIRKVYIYGDGAPWIMNGFDIFPCAVHILDEFHFKKRLRSLLAGEICTPYAATVNKTISSSNKLLFAKVIDKMLAAVNDKMPESKARTGRVKAIKESSAYIQNFWGAVQNMRLPESIGSCTEAMVSHVLSERFSRNPMGWSRAGLSKMSMIRVFVVNGGKISPADTLAWKKYNRKNTEITKLEKYEALVKKQYDKLFKESKDWRWFEVDNMISGKTTGTRVILNAFGRIQNIS
jgi:hypothetical protein